MSRNWTIAQLDYTFDIVSLIWYEHGCYSFNFLDFFQPPWKIDAVWRGFTKISVFPLQHRKTSIILHIFSAEAENEITFWLIFSMKKRARSETPSSRKIIQIEVKITQNVFLRKEHSCFTACVCCHFWIAAGSSIRRLIEFLCENSITYFLCQTLSHMLTRCECNIVSANLIRLAKV